jgi:hypothetical protein
MRLRRATPVLGALVGLLAAAGCGGSGQVSAGALKPRLLEAAALPGYRLERTLDWRDPVDLVAQGMFLPAATAPSAAVKVVRDAGLRGAAGEVLASGSGIDTAEITVGVAEFKSAAAATRMRDWMHQQDLQQPCFSECIFSPHAAALPGVPNGVFVVQSSHPPGQPAKKSPTNFHVEFTKGPYLYFAATQGSPGDQPKVVAGTQLYYRHVRRLS